MKFLFNFYFSACAILAESAASTLFTNGVCPGKPSSLASWYDLKPCSIT